MKYALLLPDRGRSLKRLHRPNRFNRMGFKGKPELKVLTDLDPVCLGCGPYEASEGIYPCRRQRKNCGEGKLIVLIDRIPFFD